MLGVVSTDIVIYFAADLASALFAFCLHSDEEILT